MNPGTTPSVARPQQEPFSLETKLGFEDIKDCLPPALAKLACKSQQIMGVAPETCAAAGLAHLAASYGRHILIDDGITRRAPSLNFLAVSDQPPSSDWMAFLGRRWTDVARRATGIDLTEVISQLNEAQKSSTTRKVKPSAGADKPVIVLASTVAPAEVGRLLRQSPDACLTLLNGIDDPLEEWSRLNAKEQSRLFTMLRESWQGRPVRTSLKDDTSLSATLVCLWSSRLSCANRSFFQRNRPFLDNPAPLIFHRVRGTPLCYPDTTAPEVKEWSELLFARFAARPRKPVDLPMVFRTEAERFALEVRAEISKEPALHRPWLGWTYDLLPKVFTLLWNEFLNMWEQQKADKMTEHLLKSGEDASTRFAKIEMERIKAQVEATIPKDKVTYVLPKALRLTTWLIQEHHAALKLITSAPPEPQGPDIPDTPDKESLENTVLSKLREKGPVLPRRLQRSFHQMSADKLGQALSALKSQGLVLQNADGMVSLTA